MANRERMPGDRWQGVDMTARYGNRVMSNNGPATAGLIFFNDEGDECGGLVYGSKVVDGKPKAVVHLSFDHFRQNEAIDIGHVEETERAAQDWRWWTRAARLPRMECGK